MKRNTLLTSVICVLMIALFSFGLILAKGHYTVFTKWAGNSYSSSTMYSRALVAGTGKDTSHVFMLAINERKYDAKYTTTTVTTAFWGTENSTVDSMFNVIYMDLSNDKVKWYPWDNSSGIWDTLSSATGTTAATVYQVKASTSVPVARYARFRVNAGAAAGDTSVVGGEIGLTYE